MIEGTRDYLETVLRQVNGCYAHGHYDACAVMLRRLIETLIIECYETHGIADAIKDSSESFVGLDELIRRFLAQKKWNIGRNARRHLKELPSIKGIGDLSAHNRRFTATKNDIDRIANEARVAIQELATIAFGEN
ncbi:MAG: DUF4145 domain-containing protein [Deltaproteobacteria bacterium]|nr:DUF4145 domain-containing protein [Deltaproteobacteria bacterium]